MKTITVVLPAKDEEVGLGQLANEFKESSLRNRDGLSITIVVDSRSSDHSREIANLLADKIIDQKRGHGKGLAIKSAIAEWKINTTDFFIMMDSDGSYLWQDVERIIQELESGAQVVSGVRLEGLFKRTEGMSILHHFGNHALSLISSLRNRKKIYDLCTGLWGFEENALKQISPISDGFDLEAEIHGRIRINGLSHIQIPIKWRPRIGGEAKIRSFVDGFKILYRTLVT